jgi:hypothetical protein
VNRDRATSCPRYLRFLPRNAVIAWSRRALSASNSLMIASVSMLLLDG